MPKRSAQPPAALALAVALLAGGCGTHRHERPPGEHPAVRTAIGHLMTAGDAPGAAALSWESGRDRRFTATGVADLRSHRRIRPEDRFRAGSITKTFVATVVLQLAAERRLSLSDAVEAHLPGLVRGNGNDGRRITVRQLLGHTSGLFDYVTDRRLSAGFFGQGFSEHRRDSRTPRQLVRTALRHAPYFPPGSGYHYSNTDYVLLGLIVEKVTGRPYAREIERRILGPLGLTGTSFPGTRESLPGPHGRAYSGVAGPTASPSAPASATQASPPASAVPTASPTSAFPAPTASAASPFPSAPVSPSAPAPARTTPTVPGATPSTTAPSAPPTSPSPTAPTSAPAPSVPAAEPTAPARPVAPSPAASAPPSARATPRPVDVTDLDPSGAGAAGEAVSTLGDLNRFFHALLSGALLPPEQLRLMRDTSRTHGRYGLGLFPTRLSCGVTVWGHNGSILGSYVRTAGTADGSHVFSYRVNTDAVGNERAERRALEAEFCRAHP